MSTPYEEIFGLFSGMRSDYLHLLLPQETQDEILYGWLISAISSFDNCINDLSDRDETLKQFNATLSDKEKVILAKYMLCEWMSPQLYSIDYFQNTLSSKDFNQFSPANLLKEVRDTYNSTIKKVNLEKNAYSHKNFNPLNELRR